jgi:hypothetical protein
VIRWTPFGVICLTPHSLSERLIAVAALVTGE